VVLRRPFVVIFFVFLSFSLSFSHSAVRRCRGRPSILSCRCFRSEGILQQPVECDKAQGVAVVINSYYPFSRSYILYVRTDDDNVPSSLSSCRSSVPCEMPFVKQQCILNAYLILLLNISSKCAYTLFTNILLYLVIII